MSFQTQLITLFISFLFLQLAKPDDLPAFAFSWLNDLDTFKAGDTAIIKVKVLGNYESKKYEFSFNPNVTVNDKMGNSSFVSGVRSEFGNSTDDWRICFTPIMVGTFYVLLSDDNFKVSDSSMHFQVNPGDLYPAAAILHWKGGVDEFIAGNKAEVLILPKDAFGNNVSSKVSNMHNFTVYASAMDGSPAVVLNVTENGWDPFGYVNIEFILGTAGSLLLHVEAENQTLEGSPLPFKVNPGELDVYSCILQWNVETKFFQLFSILEAFINQHDRSGNLVLGQHAFDVKVLEKGTNLSMPVSDLSFKDISPGVLSFSFSLQEPGNFMLMIFDKGQNNLISNMPYDFTVYTAYCDGANSIVNGSGLDNSAAGDIAKFSVFLMDAYLYPSPVELESLQVKIVHVSDMELLTPSIQIAASSNDSFVSRRFEKGESNRSSVFYVSYKPEKSGTYEICVFCGNIPVNGGHPFNKEVIPGSVNVSLSGVVKFERKVPKLAINKIVVQLMDSYYNPVLQQASKLKVEIASINKSAFSTWPFLDNNNGTYTVTYMAKDVGTYEICVSYSGLRFIPCPFGVNVYNSEYFPKVNKDTISVWEDESIAFNVLANDYFAGRNASILEYSKPGHGSLLQSGNFFRYTPYRGFYGNDSFSYTIQDINENVDSGLVELLVLCLPPQFVSVPTNLLATEDTVNPKFGGFAGFQIAYSDLTENITVTVSSQFGTIMLSPTPIQFWQHNIWNDISVDKTDGNTNELTLVGCVDIINFALQSIQYSGNENFYGETTIQVSTMNKNGRNDVNVPIYVQPINDPPLIDVPSFIILQGKGDGILIFGGRRNNSNFISDPDILNFPGNRSRFFVMFSLEVSSGLLSASLPAELIGSTEVKLKANYRWQPLLTFVTISKHFLVKAKGIRFQGSIDDCNSIMQQLLYHGGEQGTVLIVSVNDLGNHGCYPSCDEMMSTSLFVESTVNLIRERPISSLAAHILGSAIAIITAVVLVLASLLLFYICKCAHVLVHEKKKQKSQDIELSKVSQSSKQTLVPDSPETEKPHQTYCFPVPFSFKGNNSNSKRLRASAEETDHIMQKSSPSSDDQHEQSQPSDIPISS